MTPDYVRYELNRNKDKEIHVGFCSPGGAVSDGLELYAAFKDHGNVHAHAFGMNASISTIAMLGCKTIDIVKGSFFLIHNSMTSVRQWELKNKEALEAFIEKMKLEHESLSTIDDVMAQLYADKCGKTVAEVKAQMKKGTWLSAQQAVDFGLVDSIREDEEMEHAAACATAQFSAIYSRNDFIADAGIPPLPAATSSPSPNNVADADGNPTASFLAKTWQGLQALFNNPHADKNQESMITIFTSVMALLAQSDGFKPQEDGSIALTQAQMKKLDDQLKALSESDGKKQSALDASAETVKQLQAKVQELEAAVKAKDEQILALSKGAGAEETHQAPNEAGADFNVDTVFNLTANI